MFGTTTILKEFPGRKILSQVTYLLRQHVDSQFVLGSLGPQLNLCQDLVCEGVTHHKAWVTVSTAQVYKTSFSQQDEVAAIFHCVAINLKDKTDNCKINMGDM